MNFNDLFIYDDGLLINKKSGNIYCNEDKDGYIRVRISGKEYRAHRIIWEMFNGPIPEGLLIDHIDRDVYNNRIENLRLVTRQQNNMNSGSKKSEGYKGVSKTVSGTYRARLSHKGITYCLGTYKTIEEAKTAYDEKALELQEDYFPK